MVPLTHSVDCWVLVDWYKLTCRCKVTYIVGWTYFDYQKPGHSARQTNTVSKFTQRYLINFNTFKV